jgi:hypothetical protein
MKKNTIVFVFLLLALCSAFSVAQEKKLPFTKEEILRVLKLPSGQRAQGDLAGEVAERGVAFKVNDSTLTELKKAGAKSYLIDAILQASQTPGSPPQPPPPTLITADKTTPSQPEASQNFESPEARAAAIARLPLIEQARFHAADFMDELPNFVATQIVKRAVMTPQKKDWQEEDTLEIEVTYRVKEGEKFKLQKINGKPSSQSYEKLEGATSTGEFGSMLSALFSPESKAEFKEMRHEKFKGRDTVVFEFKIKKAFSSYQILDKTSGRTVTSAYSGTVWIDTESKRVLRLEQSCEDIQKGFAFTVSENAVEYDWVTISGTRYLLPSLAEIILGNDISRAYLRNTIELKNYRVFDTDVKMILEKETPK